VAEFLERQGSEIIGVQVSRRLKVPLEMLRTAIWLDDEAYKMHPLGGGLVAGSSYVPDTVSVPHGVVIGSGTRVLTHIGIFGQTHIKGDFKNPNIVSLRMDDDGAKLLADQEEEGLIRRLLAIEYRRKMSAAADIADALF